MSWINKSRVIAVFGVGLFACIASVLRLLYSSELTRVPIGNYTYQLYVDRVGLWAYVTYSLLRKSIVLTTIVGSQSSQSA